MGLRSIHRVLPGNLNIRGQSGLLMAVPGRLEINKMMIIIRVLDNKGGKFNVLPQQR
jgi:hypothetical protein